MIRTVSFLGCIGTGLRRFPMYSFCGRPRKSVKAVFFIVVVMVVICRFGYVVCFRCILSLNGRWSDAVVWSLQIFVVVVRKF